MTSAYGLPGMMVSMKWTPITRGKPKVLGINEKYSGLLNVELDLSDTPPREWAEFFTHPTGIGISMSMHPPKLSGHIVSLRPPDGEIEKYVNHIDERIVAANAYYERQVIPDLEAAEARQEQSRKAEQMRLDEARRRAEKL